MKSKREYCCSGCGLIWFAETTTSNSTVCPECGNNNQNGGLIYACDSFAFAYAFNSIEWMLRDEGKKIHVHTDHPKYKNGEMT